MFDLNTAANWAQVISVVVPAIGAVYGFYRRIEKRQTKFESDLALICQRLDFVIGQFGPNGGGLRQAVNEIGDRLDTIEKRQIQIGDNVAELDGRFSQHIVEND